MEFNLSLLFDNLTNPALLFFFLGILAVYWECHYICGL